MDQLKKRKTTAVDLPKGIPSDWKKSVWEKNKIDFKFWEESWNKDFKT